MWPAQKIMMLRPETFGFNSQTAITNSFQNENHRLNKRKVKHEFDQAVKALRACGIDVIVQHDTPEPHKPDALFLNNWFSTLPNGLAFLYPMCHTNRRAERNHEAIRQFLQAEKKLIDLSYLENDEFYLEGTGSLVIDHDYKIAYASLSPRTSIQALKLFEKESGLQVLTFQSYDENGQAIYHTNVVMALSPQIAIVCFEVINNQDRKKVEMSLLKCRKKIINISYAQLKNFAGNMICLKNKKNETFMIMSARAYNSLTDDQRNQISNYHHIVQTEVANIETIGGGSVRCMIAELF